MPFTDKLLLLGDFNAREGTDHLAWSGVIGRHCCRNMNDNSHRLLSLCSRNKLFIRNIGLTPKPIHKGTWIHTKSKHAHMLDYVFTRQQGLQDVQFTRTKRGGRMLDGIFSYQEQTISVCQPTNLTQICHQKMELHVLARH